MGISLNIPTLCCQPARSFDCSGRPGRPTIGSLRLFTRTEWQLGCCLRKMQGLSLVYFSALATSFALDARVVFRLGLPVGQLSAHRPRTTPPSFGVILIAEKRITPTDCAPPATISLITLEETGIALDSVPAQPDAGHGGDGPCARRGIGRTV